MENLFASCTDTELRAMYSYYINWRNTGIIQPNTALSKMRDDYIALFGHHGLVILELDYLREIASRYMN